MDGFKEPVAMTETQKRLEQNGFYVGEQGEHTELALRKFQKAHGLPETGEEDEATLDKLAEGLGSD